MSRRAVGAAIGLLVGMAAGYVWWSHEQAQHRRDLFSARPGRRLAALGWINAEPSVEAVLLLREYVRWERNPLLRRRGRQVLARLEQVLT